MRIQAGKASGMTFSLHGGGNEGKVFVRVGVPLRRITHIAGLDVPGSRKVTRGIPTTLWSAMWLLAFWLCSDDSSGRLATRMAALV